MNPSLSIDPKALFSINMSLDSTSRLNISWPSEEAKLIVIECLFRECALNMALRFQARSPGSLSGYIDVNL